MNNLRSTTAMVISAFLNAFFTMMALSKKNLKVLSNFMCIHKIR